MKLEITARDADKNIFFTFTALNAFNEKDALKAVGFKWENWSKAWIFQADTKEEAKALVVKMEEAGLTVEKKLNGVFAATNMKMTKKQIEAAHAAVAHHTFETLLG